MANDKTRSYEYKFGQEIPDFGQEITNKITKLPRITEKVVSFLQKESFFVVANVFLFFLTKLYK